MFRMAQQLFAREEELKRLNKLIEIEIEGIRLAIEKLSIEDPDENFPDLYNDSESISESYESYESSISESENEEDSLQEETPQSFSNQALNVFEKNETSLSDKKFEKLLDIARDNKNFLSNKELNNHLLNLDNENFSNESFLRKLNSLKKTELPSFEENSRFISQNKSNYYAGIQADLTELLNNSYDQHSSEKNMERDIANINRYLQPPTKPEYFLSPSSFTSRTESAATTTTTTSAVNITTTTTTTTTTPNNLTSNPKASDKEKLVDSKLADSNADLKCSPNKMSSINFIKNLTSNSDQELFLRSRLERLKKDDEEKKAKHEIRRSLSELPSIDIPSLTITTTTTTAIPNSDNVKTLKNIESITNKNELEKSEQEKNKSDKNKQNLKEEKEKEKEKNKQDSNRFFSLPVVTTTTEETTTIKNKNTNTNTTTESVNVSVNSNSTTTTTTTAASNKDALSKRKLDDDGNDQENTNCKRQRR